MAVLVGTIIGLSKMQGDSEIVAVHAAGMSKLQITAPILLLGIILSVFAFVVNLRGVPLAAQIVRSVVLRTAIQKLESPIEPGVFNTEVAGYTIYVKGADPQSGTWKNIFIYSEDPANGLVRLITSSNGRIDISGEDSELVLENASVASFPTDLNAGKFVSETIGEIRIAVQTRRGELIQKLTNGEESPEELGLSQLADYAASREGKDRTEAEILWVRRIILSISPLIFCLLGVGMVLQFPRSGRGFGTAIALLGLVVYYLLTFLGEQLARTQHVPVFVGALLPIVVSAAAILWFNFSRRIDFWTRWVNRLRAIGPKIRNSTQKIQSRNLFVDLTTGLRDLDLIGNLLKYFALTLSFLAAVFIIFTAFELWKFAGTQEDGIRLLSEYLFFLLPFIYIQLAPSAAMVAILATYVIKSRRNEIVTWTAAGQSVYRLLIPCFLLLILLGVVNFQIEEHVSPAANQIQDELRAKIRSGGVLKNRSGKFWVANDRRIYSFELDRADGSAILTAASDNETGLTACPCVKNLTLYEFSGGDKTKLQSVYRASNAAWENGNVIFFGRGKKTDITDSSGRTIDIEEGKIEETENPFLGLRKKPSQLSIAEVKSQIRASGSEVEQRSLSVAVAKKQAVLFLPIVIGLFTAPFALSLSRKGKAITVGYAVGLWLLFTGITGVFEQFGLSGNLSAELAVWTPLFVFAAFGIYLLTKIRT
jgi:lipopolysaccharide export LptBFGC system permease protein LptF